ncbi:MAG: UDP-N-acetylmuramoyl-L-alanine--D-glutamate ligase [Rhodospirillaceae bacterium]|nr:UDP-N-acetylmuramoyl-L-alanine--D-glutamate ligase [Rhodospirillaceae bacterium]
MIPLNAYSNKAVLVVGYGTTGIATAAALHKSGANVFIWDDDHSKKADAQKKAFQIFDENTCDLNELEAIIWSPGIPHTYPSPHPLAKKVLSSGHVLRCDIDLLAETQADAFFIGITGTNGKSTTTALTQHILKSAKRTTEVGGNFGIAALDLKPLKNGAYYILELSSYQLELCPKLSCNIAVLLNITPDHLERHNGIKGYINSKKRLLQNQTNSALKVIVNNDTHTNQIINKYRKEKKNIIEVSCNKDLEDGIVISDGFLIDRKWNTNEIIDLKNYACLPGQHNWLNAGAAYAITKSIGVSSKIISSAFSTFSGLNHRQELIGKSRKVTFINDSKATNANATLYAMNCYNNIYWIAGGIPKDDGIEPLKPLLHRVAHAFLIGQSTSRFAKTLEQENVKFSICKNLYEATVQAGRQAEKDELPEPVVLLSPASASFDEFKDFEERGNHFRQIIINNWPEVAQ